MDKQELQMAKKLNAGFRVLDDISDMNSSYIHVDWSDIKAAMGGNDLAWSGAGQAEGTDGIVEAAKRAKLCPMSCANVVGPSSGAVSVR